jgi:hypothetical protein
MVFLVGAAIDHFRQSESAPNRSIVAQKWTPGG